MPRAHAKSRRSNRNLSAFLYGVGHALDLGGILARNRGRFSGGFAADAEALRRDWDAALSSDSIRKAAPATGDGKA